MKTILTILVTGGLLVGHLQAQSQLLELPPPQADVAELARNMEGNSYYLGLAINQVNATWGAVWAKPTARLEAMLNAIGAVKVQQLVQSQALAAARINDLLDATQSPLPRVVATPGRTYTVNPETGYITVVPLPEEEPAAEPESAWIIQDAPVLASRDEARPRLVKAILSWRE